MLRSTARRWLLRSGWAITYADLEKRTRRVAIHLVRAGIARGNIVAIVLGRCLWAIESVLAILRAELAKILGHSGAGVIITDGRHLATVRAAAREGSMIIITTASPDVVNMEGEFRIVRYQDWAEDECVTFDINIDDLGDDEEAFLHYTSGTTSLPKGVLSSQKSWMWNVTSVASAIGLTPGDRFFWPLPLFHCLGHSLCIIATVAVGASAYLPDADQIPFNSLLDRQAREATIILVDLDGNQVNDGEQGEVWIRGPGLMLKYYKETRAPFTSDVGRKKELIIRGGENILPNELERVLLQHPGVADVVVAGIPHGLLGEIPAAFIVKGDADLDLSALLAVCREALPDYKVPAAFYEIDVVPRTLLVLAEMVGACVVDIGPEERDSNTDWLRRHFDQPFSVLGLSSMAGVVLRDRLASLTGLAKLPNTLVFDYPTPAAVSEYLYNRDFPDDRGWNVEALYSTDPNAPGTSTTKRGGFLPDFADFDADLFGMAPRILYDDYEDNGFGNHGAVEAHLGLGSSSSVVSGRVSYCFGLHGPSLAVSTGCSSSLVAIHQAAQSLRNSECLILLERLSDATRNGHQICSLIRGSAVNSDGTSNGLTAPSGPAQQMCIQSALAQSGLSPADVDVLEGHGTATPIGDPIEIQAVISAYGNGNSEGNDKSTRRSIPLLLGSIKSNIGHTQAAAAVAGIIKMVQATRHGVAPASLHIREPSRHVDWKDQGELRCLRLELRARTATSFWSSQILESKKPRN
ncbi:AMP-binding enzyme [Hirsutella rhossiliensis]|uniref:AMP-binding enzyme domain-containing protein n=1 Tax=Hirsutella rhossiliensis TaxID=111463 RepID=A0A9P8SE42_9HYPO|nr:AMP-binding enzyme domain-containing protein [Hirsutella rhossiliensis]KAH0959281.1 AMP-binding enzyme domain-containing protein [Hirsutella rhossiliensis]